MQVLRELDSLVEHKPPDDARYPCSGRITPSSIPEGSWESSPG